MVLVDPWIQPAYADAVNGQILSGFLGPGATTNEFASELGAYVGAEACLLTTSGTVALSVAAKALGLKPGDEILLPAYGVISTINAFASIGLEPRLVDVDRSTCCLRPDSLRQAISPRTRAVCYVNFAGHTGPYLEEVKQLCKQRDVALIEDAACAFGHRYAGKASGTFGDVGIYSFSVPKVITTGQGGALVAPSAEVFKRAADYIDHGDAEWRQTGFNRGIGTNLRFNDVLAALGLSQLRDIEVRLARRRHYYATLEGRLGERIYRVPGEQAPLHSIVFTRDPKALVACLRERGVPAIISPYRTISSHPAYQHLATKHFPNADFWTAHTVYLPFGVALTPEDAEQVLDALAKSGAELDSAP